MPTRFHICLLGDFRLIDDANGDAAGLGRHAQALLALLALSRDHEMSRERLASLLWEDRQDEQARRSLRQCLFTVRRALDGEADEILVGSGEHVHLNTAAVDLDVVRFEDLVAEGTLPALREACDLVRGPLLSGVTLRSEGFEEWLSGERRRLEGRLARALTELAEHLLDARDLDGATETAERLVALDPLDETACRLLMHAHAAGGRRAEALRQYNLLCERLHSDLAAEPAAETRELAVRLRKEMPPADRPNGKRFEVAAEILDFPNGPKAGDVAEAAPEAAVTVPAPRRNGRRRRIIEYAAVATATLVVVGLAHSFWQRGGVARLAERTVVYLLGLGDTRPSLAIVPFDNLGETEASISIARALNEDIGASLSTISSIRVFGNTSVFGDQATQSSNAEIARRLNARYVLDGTVQTKGENVRVWLHLVDHATNRELWARRFSEPLKDIFDLQDRITIEVVTSLQVQLAEGEQERIALIHGTRNLDAWLLAGEARQLLRRLVKADNARARRLYQRAATDDPAYPAAWEGLGWSHLLAAWFGWTDDPAGALREADTLARKALDLDPKRGRVHSLIGSIRLTAGHCEDAVRQGEEAIRINPQDAEANAMLAFILSHCGDVERSIGVANAAIQLSPYPPAWYRWNLGRAYRLAGRYDEAVRQLTLGLENHRLTHIPRIELLLALERKGDRERAARLAAEILKIAPGFRVGTWLSRSIDPDPARRRQEAALLRDAGLPE